MKMYLVYSEWPYEGQMVHVLFADLQSAQAYVADRWWPKTADTYIAEMEVGVDYSYSKEMPLVDTKA